MYVEELKYRKIMIYKEVKNLNKFNVCFDIINYSRINNK
jgi:hypothetical protein